MPIPSIIAFVDPPDRFNDRQRYIRKTKLSYEDQCFIHYTKIEKLTRNHTLKLLHKKSLPRYHKKKRILDRFWNENLQVV